MATSIWFWVAFIAFVLGMLALDLGVFHRKAHVIHPKEAAIWTGVWVTLAMLFAAGLAVFQSPQSALTFVTGYVIEESLSIDNIFVIVLIFEYFRVPKLCQHRVLFYGILGALVMRGIFIGVGAALIASFHWILYIFGALLIVTGVRMAMKGDEQFKGVLDNIKKDNKIDDEAKFQEALKQEGMTLADLRRQATTERKGLLSRLMGKKDG